MLYGWLVSWIALGLLRWPAAPLLAMLVGILEMVPFAGPVISGVVLGTIALARGDLWILAGFCAYLAFLRITIDNFVGPMVLGRAVRLHPVAIIFALLAGGALLGVLGILLAVPAAASIKVMLQTIYDEQG